MCPADVEGVERLYGLPLDGFVRERDALARELRKAGHREEADEVKALPKPSLAAWAVNQLARRRADEVRRLLEAAERLRSAQLSGEGDFAEAARAEQDAVRVLVRGAGDVLREAGRPATDATLTRVGQTLHAAVADEEGRADLERGTLRRELEPAGFGVLAGALPAGRARPAPARSRPAPAPRERDRRREKRKRLEEELKRARAEARELERAARQARARADKAQADVERIERRLSEL
jgi:hypothetical protein